MKRVIVFIALALSLMAQTALASSDWDMTVRTAYDGRSRAEGWTTVIADVRGQDDDFSGELVVSPKDAVAGRSVTYSVPISLSAGGQEQFQIHVPSSFSPQLDVKLMSDGVVLDEQEVSLTILSAETLFIGILTPEEGQISSLSGLGQDGDIQATWMDPAVFPAVSAQLGQFDVILLSQVDTERFSQEQRLALKAWVAQGGTLVLAGGPQREKALSSLPSTLVPVEISGTREVELSPLGTLAGNPLAGTATASHARVLRGRVLAEDSGVPLVVADQVGLGKVVYLAVDPSQAPLAGWSGLPALVNQFLQPRELTGRHGSPNRWIASSLQYMPHLAMPSLAVVGLLLAGYLLLVGPVNYLVLRRLDRREWAWITVPVLSLCIVLAVYVVGLGRRVSVMSNLISVTQIAPDTGIGSVQSFVGVYAPSRQQMEVALKGSGAVEPVHLGRNDDLKTQVATGVKNAVHLQGLNNYSMAGFVVKQDAVFEGRLALVEATVDDQGVLHGRLKNGLHFPLSDTKLALGPNQITVGSLAPGAVSEPFSLKLTQEPGSGRYPFLSGGPMRRGPRRDLDVERRDTVWAAIRDQVGMDGSSTQLLVGGWAPEPFLPASLPSEGQTFQDTNLVYTVLPLSVDMFQGDLPPGIVQASPLGGGGAWMGNAEEGYFLPPGVHRFHLLMPELEPDRVAEVRLHLNAMEGKYAIRVRNQRTRSWQDLDATSIQTLDPWQELIGEAGLMELEVEVREGQVVLAPPTVSVKGVSR